MECAAEFRGFTRRHNCRYCRIVVCASCSDRQKPRTCHRCRAVLRETNAVLRAAPVMTSALEAMKMLGAVNATLHHQAAAATHRGPLLSHAAAVVARCMFTLQAAVENEVFTSPPQSQSTACRPVVTSNVRAPVGYELVASPRFKSPSPFYDTTLTASAARVADPRSLSALTGFGDRVDCNPRDGPASPSLPRRCSGHTTFGAASPGEVVSRTLWEDADAVGSPPAALSMPRFTVEEVAVFRAQVATTSHAVAAFTSVAQANGSGATFAPAVACRSADMLAALLSSRTFTAADVAGCVHVNDNVVALIAAQCNSSLRALCVADTQRKISHQALIALARDCGNLRELSVAGSRSVTDATLAAVAQQCPHLSHLNVSNTTRVTDASILEIAARCHALRALDVSHTSAISNVSLAAIAVHCPALQSLNVSYTGGRVGDAAMGRVARGCRGLTHVDAGHTRGAISDVSVIILAECCSALEHLSVASTDGAVTDAAIFIIAERSGNLKHLDLSGTHGVTDSSVALVGRSCTALEWLSVANSGGAITDRGVTVVARHCPGLTHLNVTSSTARPGSRGCVPADCVTTIRKLLPMCVVEND
jgi:hypothetical protein